MIALRWAPELNATDEKRIIRLSARQRRFHGSVFFKGAKNASWEGKDFCIWFREPRCRQLLRVLASFAGLLLRLDFHQDFLFQGAHVQISTFHLLQVFWLGLVHRFVSISLFTVPHFRRSQCLCNRSRLVTVLRWRPNNVGPGPRQNIDNSRLDCRGMISRLRCQGSSV